MKSDLKGYLDNLEKEVVDYDNVNCIECNDCCGSLSLITIEEYNQLKKYFTKNTVGKSVYEIAVKRVFSMMKEHDALYLQCPLSTREKRCAIYNRRPSVCRDFHCKKELNLVCEGKERREVYGGKTIFDLFRDDLLKNKEFNKRFIELAKHVTMGE